MTMPYLTQDQKYHILFVCTEDWFFRSHFLPLNEAALSQKNVTTSIICNTGTALDDLEKAGLKVLPLDFSRKSASLFSALKLLWHLQKAIRREKPDLIHFIALKPVLTGGLVGLFFPKIPKIYHITGLGTLSEGKGRIIKVVRTMIFSFVSFLLSQRKSRLMIENPDDLAFLRGFGKIADMQVTLLGGAGVNPDIFYQMPYSKKRGKSQDDKVHISYVGRMIWTKGVDVLVAAHQSLHKSGIYIKLDLYGVPDPGNPKSVTEQTLADWNQRPNITWHGKTEKILAVWQKADIAIVPTRTREGLPRAMLEAASCGRPLIVTDVPGCRHFVRDGVEGFVVTPDNVRGLAEAIRQLCRDPERRKKMGYAARKRVLEGYMEDHIRTDVARVYKKILGE